MNLERHVNKGKGELTQTPIICWMNVALPPRNQCYKLFLPSCVETYRISLLFTHAILQITLGQTIDNLAWVNLIPYIHASIHMRGDNFHMVPLGNELEATCG